MASSQALLRMPYVFRTRDFCALSGLHPSAASRALRHAGGAGAVDKLGWGLWQRKDIEAPVAEALAEHPFPPAWMNVNEQHLDAILGTTPRRLSHMMALEAAGIPLVIRPQLAIPKEHPIPRGRFNWRLFREPENRISAFAAQLTERTWLSSPTRAAVEVAHCGIGAPLWDERIAWAFAECSGDMFDVDEAREIGSDLKMRAGLRRLASIAHALLSLREEGIEHLGAVPENWAHLETAQKGDAWISLRRKMKPLHAPEEAAWTDRERKVLWDRHPRELAETLLT